MRILTAFEYDLVFKLRDELPEWNDRVLMITAAYSITVISRPSFIDKKPTYCFLGPRLAYRGLIS
jgi:hypothetical protein